MLYLLTFSKVIQFQKNQNLLKEEHSNFNINFAIFINIRLVLMLQYEQNDQNLQKVGPPVILIFIMCGQPKG